MAHHKSKRHSAKKHKRTTRKRHGGAPAKRYSITLVSDISGVRPSDNINETFGPFGTEKQAVQECLKYMLTPRTDKVETLYIDGVTGADEEWVRGNRNANPRGTDMTQKLLRETTTFAQLKKVCENFDNSFYQDGWDISMDVTNLDTSRSTVARDTAAPATGRVTRSTARATAAAATARPTTARETAAATARPTTARETAATARPTAARSTTGRAMEYTVKYQSNYNGLRRVTKLFGPDRSEEVVVKKCLEWMLDGGDSEGGNLDVDPEMEMDPNELEEFKEKLVRDTKTFAQLKAVCEKYENSYFEDDEGWNVTMIRK